MTPAADTLKECCGRLAAVDLEAVIALAGLQTRIDRKYLVPHTVLVDLLRRLEERLWVLDIQGRRTFDYESVYFDTPDLLAYHQHAHGRRRRFKVRTRTYLNSEETVLEVKTEGGRAQTVKHRTPYTMPDRYRLNARAQDVLSEELPTGIADLRTSLISRYQRATLLDPATGSRVTCDVGLTFQDHQRTLPGPADQVLLESKTTGPAAPVDTLLWRMGHRPVALSKYCVGLALLNPHLPANRWNRTLRRGFGWAPAKPTVTAPSGT